MGLSKTPIRIKLQKDDKEILRKIVEAIFHHISE